MYIWYHRISRLNELLHSEDDCERREKLQRLYDIMLVRMYKIVDIYELKSDDAPPNLCGQVRKNYRDPR